MIIASRTAHASRSPPARERRTSKTGASDRCARACARAGVVAHHRGGAERASSTQRATEWTRERASTRQLALAAAQLRCSALQHGLQTALGARRAGWAPCRTLNEPKLIDSPIGPVVRGVAPVRPWRDTGISGTMAGRCIIRRRDAKECHRSRARRGARARRRPGVSARRCAQASRRCRPTPTCASRASRSRTADAIGAPTRVRRLSWGSYAQDAPIYRI